MQKSRNTVRRVDVCVLEYTTSWRERRILRSSVCKVAVGSKYLQRSCFTCENKFGKTPWNEIGCCRGTPNFAVFWIGAVVTTISDVPRAVLEGLHVKKNCVAGMPWCIKSYNQSPVLLASSTDTSSNSVRRGWYTFTVWRGRRCRTGVTSLLFVKIELGRVVEFLKLLQCSQLEAVRRQRKKLQKYQSLLQSEFRHSNRRASVPGSCMECLRTYC